MEEQGGIRGGGHRLDFCNTRHKGAVTTLAFPARDAGPAGCMTSNAVFRQARGGFGGTGRRSLEVLDSEAGSPSRSAAGAGRLAERGLGCLGFSASSIW